jgi:hypothetical protein
MTQEAVKPNGYKCESCGAPATRMTADDVPLCEQDYQHILTEDSLRTLYAVLEIRSLRWSVQTYLQRKRDRDFFAGSQWSPQQISAMQQLKEA